MSADKFARNLEKLFSQVEPPAVAASNGESSSLNNEIEFLRQQVADLKAQLHEANQRTDLAQRAAELARAEAKALAATAQPTTPRPNTPLLYESDQVGYAFQQDQVEPFLDPQPAKSAPNQIFESPLVASGQAIGALRIESEPDRTWTADERQLASAIAQQLSQQVENLRLLSAAERARAEAEAANRRFTHESWEAYLNAIQRGERIGYAYDQLSVTPMVERPNPAHTFQEPMLLAGEQIGALYIEAKAGQALSAEEQALVSNVARQLTQQVENLRLLADATRARAEAEALTRRFTRDSWQVYAESHHGQDLSFVYDQHQVTPFDQTVSPEAAALVQPLTVRGETIGQLAVADTEQLSESDTALMESVAARLSAHIENLRLNEQTQKRAAELAAIAQVSTAASTTLEANKLLQAVVNLTKGVFGLYHAHIYLLDSDTELLTLAAGSGEVGKQMVADGWKIPLARESSLVAQVARNREGLILNDVQGVPNFFPNPLLPNTRSELAVPMIASDKVLGVLDIQSDSVGRFSEDDIRIQSTLAAQVAIALQNAQLYAAEAEATNKLREVDRLKSAFLANMSHELRTPLNSIIGFTDVILEGLDGPLTDRMTYDLGLVQKNGQHLLSLINDILDMAKIEAGRLELSLESFDLQKVLEEVTALVGPLARDKHLDLRLETGSEHLGLEGDRMRLTQVVINIVNNAVKFTGPGGAVTIRAERTNEYMRVSVHDTGIGIPTNQLDAVFKEFTQVDISTTRKVGGTGLGLPISRHLIELHNGRLWAESSGVPGEGSAFIFEVPVQTQAREIRWQLEEAAAN